MNAKDIMSTTGLVSCQDDYSIEEAARMMDEKDVGSILVVNPKGQLVGIVTDRDICCRALSKGLNPKKPVREIMSPSVHTVNEYSDLKDIEKTMQEFKVHRIPVVDEDQKCVGIISTSDLLHHISGRKQEHEFVQTMESITTAA